MQVQLPIVANEWSQHEEIDNRGREQYVVKKKRRNIVIFDVVWTNHKQAEEHHIQKQRKVGIGNRKIGQKGRSEQKAPE